MSPQTVIVVWVLLLAAVGAYLSYDAKKNAKKWKEKK